MTARCAMCGRVTLNPAVMLAGHPVGPTCARRHSLIEPARRGLGVLSMAKPVAIKRDPRTPDLFEGLA